MGGFTLAFDSENIGFKSFLPDDVRRATLKPEGLTLLMALGPETVPNISVEHIRDKSKADGFKKTLVCIQALWFCIQCITRFAQSLPVSLLELNTFSHALCTPAIYIFSWEKPLDIEQPTVIDERRLHPLFAYMWMSSRVSAQGHCDVDMPDGLQDEFHCLWPFREPVLNDLNTCQNIALAEVFTGTPIPDVEGSVPSRRNPPTADERWSRQKQMDGAKDVKEIIKVFRERRGLVEDPRSGRGNYVSPLFRFKQCLRSIFFPGRAVQNIPPGLGSRGTAISHVSFSDVLRWSHALNAIYDYKLEGDLQSRHRTATSGRCFSAFLNMRIPFLDAIQNNLLNPRLELRSRNAVPLVAHSGVFPGFAITGALYGGLHLVASSAPLSSPLEELFWRISGVSVTCSGIICGLLAMIVKTSFCKRSLSNFVKLLTRKPLDCPSLGDKVKAYSAAIGMGLIFCIILPCLPLLWYLYLASHGYLVVEPLKDIAYLPPGSFKTPVWPSYFPHIT
ncbi:MAG: hypothetical protein Q9166_002517 [cf. Caloplaca sp. 2 TL-2023]